MFYEVFIPSADPDGFDESITVDAENWMAALKSGLESTGEGGDIVRNLMCDIKDDNSIHVTDATTRRVFVLRELDEAPSPKQKAEAKEPAEPAKPAAKPQKPAEAKEPAQPEKPAAKPQKPAEAKEPAQPEKPAAKPQKPVEAKEPTQPAKPVAKPQKPVEAKEPAEPAKPAVKSPKPVEAKKPAEPAKPAAKSQKPVEAKEPAQPAKQPGENHSYGAEGERIRIGSATHRALKEERKQEARVVRKSRTKSDTNRAVEIGRPEEKVSESLIEDIFLEIQDIHEGSKPMEEVIDFVMDMAMDKIGAESGSVLFADVNGQELYFATARGPKANDIMDFRVPMGKGIVGFCTREGVSLAISDAENDPRFYKEISESLGYDTHGLLCAPIQHEGRVYGAIEVMNKKARGGFRSDETNALAYIGRQLAQYVHDEIMRNETISG